MHDVTNVYVSKDENPTDENPIYQDKYVPWK